MLSELTQTDARDGGRRGAIENVLYADVVELFGLPNVDDDPGKVDASWAVQHTDGRYLAVWNYKNGPRYTGRGRVEDLNYWSFGGDVSLAREVFGACVIADPLHWPGKTPEGVADAV
ncbi:MAG: hypothetical protein ACYSVY_01355 [Planctomycetota bacterium]|jgi:hypothetical protein